MPETYKVFDKKGKFVKNVNIGSKCKFKTMKDLEVYLKENGLYAHSNVSFENRPQQWKSYPLAQKLKYLGWEFGSNGELINTDW